MTRILLTLIQVYQRTISPDHGIPARVAENRGFHLKTCRFSPTCSQYGYEAIKKYGSIRGSVLALWRIIRCNPISTPTMETYDPVPKHFQIRNLKIE